MRRHAWFLGCVAPGVQPFQRVRERLRLGVRFQWVLILLMVLMLMPRAGAQPWLNPGTGGTGEPPPSTITFSTNRLDLDRDRTVDFEIVLEHRTNYEATMSGWEKRNSYLYTLVPLGSCRILALDSGGGLFGDIPVLTQGDPIGVATPGLRWSGSSHVLVQRVEPMGLAGPLGSVWVYAPGYSYLGVSLGTPEAPVYGWLCFSRDRGINPLYWGYARQPSVPVSAGDLSTSPALTMKVTTEPGLRPGTQWSTIGWEPEFAEAVLEEFQVSTGTWTAVTDNPSPGFYVPGYRVRTDDQSPAREVHLYRVRFGP